MNYLLGLLIILSIILGPSLWVQRTMKKYNSPDDRYTFTGAEFARKLLDALKLQNVQVGSTNLGDHYDPTTTMVRLTEDKMTSKSLTAIVVAAHEVGHAVQHAVGYKWLNLRSQLVPLANLSGRIMNIVIISMFLGMCGPVAHFPN